MDHGARVQKRLSLEYIRELIQREDPDVDIISLDEEPGSGRGDNYTSMLYRIGVNGCKRLKTSVNEVFIPWNTSIIYKVLPDSKARREAFKSELLFRNEVVFYNHVWPSLQELQDNDKKVFGGVVKVYVATSDLIAMEDLRRKGYVMADRRKGLEVDRLKLVLKALAGFHALSLTLSDLRPKVFEQLADGNNTKGIQETLFRIENEDWYRNYYRVAAKNAITMVSEALPEDQEHNREQVVGKLQAFLHEDVFFRTMCELVSTRGILTVFCHGDCWTNNFLFSSQSETADGNVDEEAVYLVDFQLMRVGSVALDLTNLLYCCTSGQVRKEYMSSLLLHYHTNLMTALKTLNPDTSRDSSATWELLNDEMRKCGRFGFGIALDILPCSTCDSDNAPDLYEDAVGGSGGGCEGNEEGRSNRAPPPGGTECARLMTDLVLELIHNRAL